jgi:uncharacterized GH25 family protein
MTILGMMLIIFFGSAELASAHDCWLQPQSFSLLPGAMLIVRLLLGHALSVESEMSLEKSKTNRFALFTPDREKNLLPDLPGGITPVLETVPEADGPGLIAMDRGFNTISLSDEVFSTYLQEEHLYDIVRQREEMGKREMERERYARCMKTLFRVGESPDNPMGGMITGQRLEILILENLKTCGIRGEIPVRILFDGRPLKDRWITAHRLDATGRLHTFSSVTDYQGKTVVPAAAPGIWLIKLVYLTPSSGIIDVDWESYWASCTFAL